MLSEKQAAARSSGIRRTSECSFGPHIGNQDAKNSCGHDVLARSNGTSCVASRKHPKVRAKTVQPFQSIIFHKKKVRYFCTHPLYMSFLPASSCSCGFPFPPSSPHSSHPWKTLIACLMPFSLDMLLRSNGSLVALDGRNLVVKYLAAVPFGWLELVVRLSGFWSPPFLEIGLLLRALTGCRCGSTKVCHGRSHHGVWSFANVGELGDSCSH
jgi:hypothetical protein